MAGGKGRKEGMEGWKERWSGVQNPFVVEGALTLIVNYQANSRTARLKSQARKIRGVVQPQPDYLMRGLTCWLRSFHVKESRNANIYKYQWCKQFSIGTRLHKYLPGSSSLSTCSSFTARLQNSYYVCTN